MAAIVNELLRVYIRMAQGEHPPIDFDWCKFAPVLLRYQNLDRSVKQHVRAVSLKTKDSAGSNNLIAYAAFLQAALDDAFWLVHFHCPLLQLRRILDKTIMDECLVKKLLDHVGDPSVDETVTFHKELSEMRQRSLDNARKKRSRSKKDRPKNVT